jgi:hypothetical protein
MYLSKMGCNFKYSSSVSGNTIQFMVINQLNAPIVPASYYATQKNITKKLTDKQNEKIVLRKYNLMKF